VEIPLIASHDLLEIPRLADKRATGSPVLLRSPFAFIRALLIRQSMGYLLTRETVMAGVSHRTFTKRPLIGLFLATGQGPRLPVFLTLASLCASVPFPIPTVRFMIENRTVMP
jgi:hypothetical protein